MNEVQETTNDYRDVLAELEKLGEVWLETKAGGRDTSTLDTKIKEVEAELRRRYKKVRRATKRAAKARA